MASKAACCMHCISAAIWDYAWPDNQFRRTEPAVEVVCYAASCQMQGSPACVISPTWHVYMHAQEMLSAAPVSAGVNLFCTLQPCLMCRHNELDESSWEESSAPEHAQAVADRLLEHAHDAWLRSWIFYDVPDRQVQQVARMLPHAPHCTTKQEASI